VATFLFSTMNTIERKKKEAERKRKARLLESDEQIRIRRQADADRNREYTASLTPEKRKRTQEDNADRSRKNRYDTYYHIYSIYSLKLIKAYLCNITLVFYCFEIIGYRLLLSRGKTKQRESQHTESVEAKMRLFQVV
jgi:hypothetical protein